MMSSAARRPAIPAVDRRKSPGALWGSVITLSIIGFAIGVACAAYAPSHRSWADVQSTIRWLPTIASRLPPNLGSASAVLLLVVAMAGPGSLILRAARYRGQDRAEQFLFSISAGLAGWVPLLLIIGTTIGLRRDTILVSTLIYLSPSVRPILSSFQNVLIAVRTRRCLARRQVAATDARRQPFLCVRSILHRRHWLTIGLIVAGLLLLFQSFLGMLQPEIYWDARWYHLGAAYHYVEFGHFYNMVAATHDAAFGLNPYQDILYTGAFSLLGVHGAKALAFAELLLLAYGVVVFGRIHFRSTRVGLFAALLLLSIPAVIWSGSTGYNDLPVALFTLLSVHALIHWLRGRDDWNWAYVASGAAAFSVGVKAFGGFTVACTFGIVILGSLTRSGRSARSVARSWLITAEVACSVCIPWWVRAGATTGNPVFPLLNGLFHSKYWNSLAAAAQGQDDRHVSGIGVPIGLIHSLWSTGVDPLPYHTLVGPLFLLGIPIGILL